jgi:hypothetical protein
MARIENVQARLHACGSRSVGGECVECAPELIGLGSIFRVVDDDIVAAGEGQRIVERARLGLWLPFRHDYHAHERRQVECEKRSFGNRVDVFDD